MKKSIYLKPEVTANQLETLGFISHYKNYYKLIASNDNDLSVEIFVNMETRKVELYVQNDPTFTTNYAQVSKDEEIEYVEPDEAYEKSTIDEFVDVTAFIEFLQLGLVEVKEG
jgi:hypothetical protein